MRRVSSYLTFPPSPMKDMGSLFLLHLSEGCPWRVLPVILALWSPDFPHAQAFALCPRSFGQLISLHIDFCALQYTILQRQKQFFFRFHPDIKTGIVLCRLHFILKRMSLFSILFFKTSFHCFFHIRHKSFVRNQSNPVFVAEND